MTEPENKQDSLRQGTAEAPAPALSAVPFPQSTTASEPALIRESQYHLSLELPSKLK